MLRAVARAFPLSTLLALAACSRHGGAPGAAASATPAASQAPAIEAIVIVPGVSAGPVRIGMTRPDVEKLGLGAIADGPNGTFHVGPYTFAFDFERHTVDWVELAMHDAPSGIRVRDVAIGADDEADAVSKRLRDCDTHTPLGFGGYVCEGSMLEVYTHTVDYKTKWLVFRVEDGERIAKAKAAAPNDPRTSEVPLELVPGERLGVIAIGMTRDEVAKVPLRSGGLGMLSGASTALPAASTEYVGSYQVGFDAKGKVQWVGVGLSDFARGVRVGDKVIGPPVRLADVASAVGPCDAPKAGFASRVTKCAKGKVVLTEWPSETVGLRPSKGFFGSAAVAVGKGG